MKVEIDIPKEILRPLITTCKGFKIPLKRGLARLACDWIAALDAQMLLFEKPASPAYRAFDWSFTVEHPEGETIESSYESSRVNWINYFTSNFDFHDKKADQLSKEEKVIRSYQKQEI